MSAAKKINNNNNLVLALNILDENDYLFKPSITDFFGHLG